MSDKVKRFEDLKVWASTMSIAVMIYEKTREIKDHYLRDQINRAAISISNNIAEGFEYDNNADFIRFLKYAKGSCGEVRNMLHFMKKVNNLGEDDFKMLMKELEGLSRQIQALIKYLKNYENNKVNVLHEDAVMYITAQKAE